LDYHNLSDCADILSRGGPRKGKRFFVTTITAVDRRNADPASVSTLNRIARRLKMSNKDGAPRMRAKGARDKIKGVVNENVGKVRGRMGDLTDNASEHFKGKIQEIKGKLQQAKGEVEEDLGVARDRRVADREEE
jgi:uncharacterized protein YjbJ (UPF0337 family)